MTDALESLDALASAGDYLPEPTPKASALIARICSYAVITLLDYHPRKEAMNNALVVKLESEKGYRVLADPVDQPSLQGVFDASRLALQELRDGGETVEAYVVAVDSHMGYQDLPPLPGSDPNDKPYAADQRFILLFAGEAVQPKGTMVVQAYQNRRWRPGAAPLGAPFISDGPDSLLS